MKKVTVSDLKAMLDRLPGDGELYLTENYVICCKVEHHNLSMTIEIRIPRDNQSGII